jgi:hypothetical protein
MYERELALTAPYSEHPEDSAEMDVLMLKAELGLLENTVVTVHCLFSGLLLFYYKISPITYKKKTCWSFVCGIILINSSSM